MGAQRNVLATTREYWDTNLEHNPLRTMPGGTDTDAGAFLSHHIEAVGDILRESAKDTPDRNYIFEKFNRLKNNLGSRDWTDPLSKTELVHLETVKGLVEGLPATNALEIALKTMQVHVINRDTTAIAEMLPRFRVALEGIKPIEVGDATAPPKLEIKELSLADYDKLYTFNELREMCRERGIHSSGDKKALISKLLSQETWDLDEIKSKIQALPPDQRQDILTKYPGLAME